MRTFDTAVEQLRDRLGVSRAFVRLLQPGSPLPVVVAEAVAPGVALVGSERDPDFSQAATFLWINRELRPLVQDDVTKGGAPAPQYIVDYYGIAAQILVPVTRGGAFHGVLGIHWGGGPRVWSDEEIAEADRFARWVGWEIELEDLRERIQVTRTTLRVDTGGDPYFPIVGEALAPGAFELRGKPGPDLRKAATMQYLLRERTTLVQSDLLATDTPPPPELIAQYGARSQILGCISEGDRLVAFVSAHHKDVREFTPAEIADVEAVCGFIAPLLQPRLPGRP